MLNTYLNQTAVYAPLTGSDSRGQPMYGKAVSLQCRRQVKTQEIITSDKRTVKAEYVYHLSQAVKEGDLLDGRRVQLVGEMTGLGGTLLGYKAVT